MHIYLCHNNSIYTTSSQSICSNSLSYRLCVLGVHPVVNSQRRTTKNTFILITQRRKENFKLKYVFFFRFKGTVILVHVPRQKEFVHIPRSFVFKRNSSDLRKNLTFVRTKRTRYKNGFLLNTVSD